MAAKALPAQDVLLQLLSYDPETGKLYWRERGPGRFRDGFHSAATQARQWNGKNAGKEAFTAVNAGYRYGAVGDVNFLAHRVIWKMSTGLEPDQIDHIDGDRQNNRFCNLRNVSETANKRNMCIPRHNTSGIIGVSKDARGGWEAHITLGNRKKSLGRFLAFDEAVAARKSAEVVHGFHENHGRSA